MTKFETNILRFMQDNLDEFDFDSTWCVTKSFLDGTVLTNSTNTLDVLKSENLSESRNQLESMRFRYPKLWSTCDAARKELVRTGKTVSLLAKFEDPSNRFTRDTDVIVVYQLWKWNEKYNAEHPALRPEFYQGMYRDAWETYTSTKCDLIICHWKLI